MLSQGAGRDMVEGCPTRRASTAARPRASHCLGAACCCLRTFALRLASASNAVLL